MSAPVIPWVQRLLSKLPKICPETGEESMRKPELPVIEVPSILDDVQSELASILVIVPLLLLLVRSRTDVPLPSLKL